MRKFFIKLLGGYSSIDDLIDGISLNDRNKILTLAVKRLFNTIDANDILKVNEYNQWLFKGKVISDGEKKNLIAEAKQFLNTKLWEILQNDVKWQANRQMFLVGSSEIDLIAGKLWLQTLNCFKTRLVSMSEESGNFNNKNG